MISQLISGGQTGADRSGLDWAIEVLPAHLGQVDVHHHINRAWPLIWFYVTKELAGVGCATMNNCNSFTQLRATLSGVSWRSLAALLPGLWAADVPAPSSAKCRH